MIERLLLWAPVRVRLLRHLDNPPSRRILALELMGLSDKPADDDITIFRRAAPNIDYNPFYHHLSPIISRYDPLKDYIASINYFILIQESRNERHLRRRLLRVYLKRRRPLRYIGRLRYFSKPSFRGGECR